MYEHYLDIVSEPTEYNDDGVFTPDDNEFTDADDIVGCTWGV